VSARRGLALVAAAVVVVAVPIGAAWAASDPSGQVSTVSQGWWNQAGPPVATPETPLGGLVAAPAVPAPDVPEGTVPVAMRLGQVQRVGAIGMTFDAPIGTRVDRLVLRLKESGDTLAQQGSGAAVRACPITDFLVPEDNGPSTNAPKADCALATVDGVRGEDGTWTFDLTPIGQAWASGALSVNGIRLEPVGAAPATFQVAFTGYADAAIEADLAPGPATVDPFAPVGSVEGAAFPSYEPAGGAFTDVATAPPAAPKARPTVPIVAGRPASGFVGSLLANLLLLAAALALALLTMVRIGAPAPAAATEMRRRGAGRGPSRAPGVRRA
jgi:hypothetical protein